MYDDVVSSSADEKTKCEILEKNNKSFFKKIRNHLNIFHFNNKTIYDNDNNALIDFIKKGSKKNK